jgi:two-component system sensor histidine kinase LytS
MTLVLYLLFSLAQWVSVVATVSFIFSQTTVFQRLVKYRLTFSDKWKMAFVFGLLGIVSTYTGIPVNDALANTRVIGPMVAGLLGGPIVGGAAGLIAGTHRYFLGGFTAFACALSSIIEGVLGGLFRQYYKERPIPSWSIALVAGLCGETLQMLIILATARPFANAYELVQTIALPMMAVNPVGVAVVIVIISTAIEQHSRIGAVQAQKALDISTQTLPYLRQGLTPASAQATAAIIYERNDYAAVSITDNQSILAHVGEGSDHHLPGTRILTVATKAVLHTGIIQIAATKQEIGCDNPRCRLGSAVVVPMQRGGQVIGVLKLYYTAERSVSQFDMQLAAGLAHLFSTQLELAEIDRQAKLASDAEMRALQAQINPHFLFNTLNTINSLIRTRPETARAIIGKLSFFFRYSLQKSDRMIPLAEELAQVDAYLDIEQTRFDSKLTVCRNLDQNAQSVLIPPFILQPIVENAIKHGLQPKEDGGTLTITTMLRSAEVEIIIADDGVGINPEIRRSLGSSAYSNQGIGLVNVYERLKGMFGSNYGLAINDFPAAGGTVISIRIPRQQIAEGDFHVSNF